MMATMTAEMVALNYVLLKQATFVLTLRAMMVLLLCNVRAFVAMVLSEMKPVMMEIQKVEMAAVKVVLWKKALSAWENPVNVAASTARVLLEEATV